MILVLASSSSIRAHLLANAGLKFSIIPPDLDESILKKKLAGQSPETMAVSLAEQKALTVSRANPTTLVIGADQILSLDGQTFDKPQTIDDARDQLSLFRGRTHQLISAAACVQNGTVLWSCADTASLAMRSFSDQFLAEYLRAGGADLFTSVGAYKLESRGIQLFDHIQGDYFTILGLPLFPLLRYLRDTGVLQA